MTFVVRIVTGVVTLRKGSFTDMQKISLTLRVSQEDLDHWRADAKRCGFNTSEYIRQMVNNAIQNQEKGEHSWEELTP